VVTQSALHARALQFCLVQVALLRGSRGVPEPTAFYYTLTPYANSFPVKMVIDVVSEN
jgi:hypothetical protein